MLRKLLNRYTMIEYAIMKLDIYMQIEFDNLRLEKLEGEKSNKYRQ